MRLRPTKAPRRSNPPPPASPPIPASCVFSSKRPRHLFQPFLRARVDQRPDLAQHTRVIRIEPRFLAFVQQDRKSVVYGKSVSVLVDRVGGGISTKKTEYTHMQVG